MADVYCICRKPQGGKWMIGCDFCDDWFHGSCIGMNETKAKLVVKFSCPRCTNKGHLGTWRRKCRLPNCMNQVAANSKYCSDEHGLEFMRSMLGDGTKFIGVATADLAKITYSMSFKEFKDAGSKSLSDGSLPPKNGDDNGLPPKEEDANGLPPKKEEKEDEEAPLNAWTQQRLKALGIAKERVKRLNEALTAESGGKKRDLCGLDWRLLDNRWKEPDFASTPITTENSSEFICMNERRKCLKHTGWHSIMEDEAAVLGGGGGGIGL